MIGRSWRMIIKQSDSECYSIFDFCLNLRPSLGWISNVRKRAVVSVSLLICAIVRWFYTLASLEYFDTVRWGGSGQWR